MDGPPGPRYVDRGNGDRGRCRACREERLRPACWFCGTVLRTRVRGVALNGVFVWPNLASPVWPLAVGTPDGIGGYLAAIANRDGPRDFSASNLCEPPFEPHVLSASASRSGLAPACSARLALTRQLRSRPDPARFLQGSEPRLRGSPSARRTTVAKKRGPSPPAPAFKRPSRRRARRLQSARSGTRPVEIRRRARP